MVYFFKDGSWREWIQAREMSTEYVLFENPNKEQLGAGKIQLSDALGNYTYYKIEYYGDVRYAETGNLFMTDTVTTDTLLTLKSTNVSGRYRSMTAINNVDKTISFTNGIQNSEGYTYIEVPKRVIAYGKKTVY